MRDPCGIVCTEIDGSIAEMVIEEFVEAVT